MSDFLKLNSQDFFKGAVLSVITAVLTTILELINNKGLSLSWVDGQQIITVVIIAFVSYMLKNLSSDSQGNPMGIGSK